MNRDQKAAVIDEVASQIEEAQAIFAVDYRGLTVRQAADLRGRLVEIDANLRVVKNTLTERAADKAGAEVLKQFLEGPTAFTFVKGDPVLAAKALAAFRRESQRPEFKGGLMDGRELTAADVEALSRLPSLDVMHGQLVGMIAAPLSGLVRSLNALLSGIAVALGQIQEQGLVQGGPGPAEVEPPAAEAEAPAEAAEAPADAISAEASGAAANGGDEGLAADAAATPGGAEAAPVADAPVEAPAAEAEAPAAVDVEAPAAADAEPLAAEAEAPADAISAEAGGAPANGGDEGVAAEAAAPAAEAQAAAAPVADAPAEASAPDAPAADAEGLGDSSPADAVGAADSPSAPADAPEPDAAEEIPNQPMPAPEQAADTGDDNETSNEEGDN